MTNARGRGRVLVFQTAFTGDVILTLPMVQSLQKLLPEVLIDFVATPSGAQVLTNHPALHEVLVYDKKGADRGVVAAARLSRHLRSVKYDAVLIPHRSFRSAAICCHAGIPRRIGFDTSAAPWLLTDKVRYDKSSHETVRNARLLLPLGYDETTRELPSLYPSLEDLRLVDEIVEESMPDPMVTVSPGSVWATKRWPEASFAELARMLVEEGCSVALVGGKEDAPLAGRIKASHSSDRLMDMTGKLTLLQSAELIRRSKVLVTNDSAPMHLAVAMRTPVVAIFGPTVPAFGFAPLGDRDVIVEKRGLKCRPCSIHGGHRCPIKTFECMKDISPEEVLSRVQAIVGAFTVEAA